VLTLKPARDVRVRFASVMEDVRLKPPPPAPLNACDEKRTIRPLPCPPAVVKALARPLA
jgi:hypothetical protein